MTGRSVSVRPFEDLHALAQHSLGADAQLVVLITHPRVGERRDVGSVDLDVLAAQADELGDLLPQDLGGIGERLEWVGVGLDRGVGVPPLAEHQRTGQRRLGRPVGPRAQVDEFLGGDRAHPAQLLADRVAGHRARQVLGAVRLIAVPGGRRGRRSADPADGVDEAAREHHAAGLAVGDDVKAALHLERDRVVDRVILHALVLQLGELATVAPRPGLCEVRGTQQGPDGFRAIPNAGDHSVRRTTRTGDPVPSAIFSGRARNSPVAGTCASPVSPSTMRMPRGRKAPV